MDELYGLHYSSMNYNKKFTGDFTEMAETEVIMNGSSDMCDDLIKAQIANHPLYPNLVSAYIECKKVGAPPEMASLLEDINKESLVFTTSSEMANDPQLDEFMESYCEVLHKYKEDLSKPFDEATTFFNNIELQLNSLCKENLMTTTTTTFSLASSSYISDEAGGTSDEDLSCGETEATENQESAGARQGDIEIKEMLLHKYSGCLSSLRKEFLKERKRGKLPKDATVVLMDWWNTHHRWPYPTEEEKLKLSEVTGLNQKQINNWFINQRKRHWRPSEDMRLALMEGVSGSIAGSVYFDAAGGGTGSSIGT